MHFVLIQIPTVICLIVMGHKAAQLLDAKEFKFVNAGWTFNLSYLFATIVLLSIKSGKETIETIGILFDAISMYCFFLAVLKSDKTYVSWVHRYFKKTYMLPVIIISAAIAIWGAFHPGLIYKVPKALLDFFILLMLSLYFKSFKYKYVRSWQRL